MNDGGEEIFVVDDDQSIRETLSILFTNEGYKVVCFVDGPALLAVARERYPACILLDVHIPGRSGLDVLKELRADDYPAPIFIISGQGDIPMAVQAIQNGALDFIQKPFSGDEIVARVSQAIHAFTRRDTAAAAGPALGNFPGREPLTRRERDVLALCLAGASSKEAGHQLGISPRTIEDHRASIMKKFGARNTADLIRIVLEERRGV